MTTLFRRARHSDALSGRFTRYFIVGGSAAIIDLGGFLLFVQGGFSTMAAAASGFAVAAVYNFALSSTIVFQVAPTWRRLVIFMTFAAVGLVVNTGVTSLAAIFTPDVIAKIIGILITFGVNFWMNNSVVFRAPRASSEP